MELKPKIDSKYKDLIEAKNTSFIESISDPNDAIVIEQNRSPFQIVTIN